MARESSLILLYLTKFEFNLIEAYKTACEVINLNSGAIRSSTVNVKEFRE